MTGCCQRQCNWAGPQCHSSLTECLVQLKALWRCSRKKLRLELSVTQVLQVVRSCSMPVSIRVEVRLIILPTVSSQVPHFHSQCHAEPLAIVLQIACTSHGTAWHNASKRT